MYYCWLYSHVPTFRKASLHTRRCSGSQTWWGKVRPWPWSLPAVNPCDQRNDLNNKISFDYHVNMLHENPGKQLNGDHLEFQIICFVRSGAKIQVIVVFHIWRFPKMGAPHKSSNFNRTSHQKNIQPLGYRWYPHDLGTPISLPWHWVRNG